MEYLGQSFEPGLTEQALEIPSILFQNESQIWSIVQDIAPDARFVSIRHGTPHTTQIRLFLRICSRFSRNSPFLFPFLGQNTVNMLLVYTYAFW